MRLYYGYQDGKFVLAVTDEEPNPTVLQRISMTRAQAQKVSKRMQFGREGWRVLEGHEQTLYWPDDHDKSLKMSEVAEMACEADMIRAPNGDPDTIVPAPAKHKRRPA